jgi:nitrogen fixation NifU-like protein
MDLKDLYQEVIVDHNRSPRNFHPMPDATRSLEGFNPLCGDRLTLYLKLDGDRIADISFGGSGCAISVASASLMTEAMKGRTLAEAEQAFSGFHAVLTDKDVPADSASMGKLTVLAGVRDYPSRIKCATLCWHTLHALIEGRHAPVSTE